MSKEDDSENSDDSFSYESESEDEPKKRECEKNSSSDVSSNHNSPPNEEVETNPYLLARARRISEIQKKLVGLGLTQPLVSTLAQEQSSEDESDEEELTSPDLSSPSRPTRKSPRIASRVVDLSGDGEDDGNVRRGVVVTRRSPRLANLSIRSPGDEAASTSATSSAGGATERSAKKRLWNSELAKSNHAKFKERIKAEIIDECSSK